MLKNKSAKTIIIVLAVTISLSPFILDFRNQDHILNRVQVLLLDTNGLEILGEKTELEKYTITWQDENPRHMQKRLLFKDGEIVDTFGHEYGINTFTILDEKEEIIDTCVLFSTNWWHSHHLVVSIEKNEGETTIDCKFWGPDSANKTINEIPMQKRF